MRIAVMGAGGIGAPYGAGLAAAGNDVTFIARGAHLAAIREGGLRVEGAQEFHIHPAQATDDPAKVGTVDLVLFAVKLWDVASAGASIKPMLGPDTTVVTLQNGVDAPDDLAAVIGADHVMGGAAEIFANLGKPGVVRQFSGFQRIRFGESNGSISPRGKAIHAAFEAAGIESELTDDIQKILWNKFIVLAPAAGMTSVTRATMGEIRDDPDTMAMLRDAILETVAVGRAKGVRLDPDIAEEAVGRVAHMPADGRSSMAVDLERGNRLELPWLNGALLRIAGEVGVDAPVNRFIHAALKLHANGR